MQQTMQMAMRQQRQAVLANIMLPVEVSLPTYDATQIQLSRMAPIAATGAPFFGGYAEDDMLAEMGVSAVVSHSDATALDADILVDE